MSPSAQRVTDGCSVRGFNWRTSPAGGRAALAPAEPSPAERLATAERDAYARGIADGERQARTARIAEADRRLVELAGALADVEARRTRLVRGAERDLVTLAMAIARRVLCRELAVDQHAILAIAHAALDKLADRATASIHLHPDDVQALQERGVSELAAVRLVADATVVRGGCMVRSQMELIDAGVDAQLDELSAAFLSEHAGAPGQVEQPPAPDRDRSAGRANATA
jgi:flagellar assembly protein FliH